MSEPAQAGKTCDLRGIREAVCVHTGKITDSCLAKDCIEDLRVYLTVDSQHTLDCAASAKARFGPVMMPEISLGSSRITRMNSCPQFGICLGFCADGHISTSLWISCNARCVRIARSRNSAAG